LSPLTKILIVLLTFASVVLCATVVSYVASADNFKEKAEQLNSDLRAATQQKDQSNKDFEKAKASFTQAESNLDRQIGQLKSEVTEMRGKLSESEREKARLLEAEDKWRGVAEDFQKTSDEQLKLLDINQKELTGARAEGVKLKKELDETSNALIEKMAVVRSLEKKVKQLEEEKSDLLAKLNEPLKPFGKQATTSGTVTPKPVTAVLPVGDIDLKALVSAIDIKNAMASVSIGSADGVTEGMRFHVTRRNEFICDILIISVDIEESVGVLELVQQQPVVGDSASTNF